MESHDPATMATASHHSITFLFDKYSGTIFRRCRKLLRNEEQAKDAVQEVFLRAWNKRDTFRGDCSPLTWLYRIATTYCLQQLRNDKRRRDILQKLLTENHPHGGLSLEESLAVNQTLDSTDEKLQHIAFYRYIDGMSMEEVAEVTGYSRKTIARKLSKFNKHARKKLFG
jgi:RNA polymerase sigma-70 factor (ECF subfamily)